MYVGLKSKSELEMDERQESTSALKELAPVTDPLQIYSVAILNFSVLFNNIFVYTSK